MSNFQAVNTSLAPEPYNRNGEETTPTTPRPSTAPQPQPATRLDDATTPTRATFGALASQRPLPVSPFPAAITVPENPETEKKPLIRGDSQYSAKSTNSEDVEMEDNSEGDGEDGSDEEESVNADGTRSTKKKKSQRFWCTDYPPCNLSFTRSEHLARHIRKHTGERPFQCHCSRRFSRLDNLRQHAQTVHLNEEIPTDSLAATGTRFQRQVRTERVRPPGNRSRAGTAGSASSQGRGHHRNSLSASSIGSMASTYSRPDDLRRRPPPLVMASDPRSRLSTENYSAATESPGQYQTYRPQSPGGYSTPTSATFSTGQNSPRWGSGMQSPVSSHSRTASLYADHRIPQRRLSVPSGANPFQSPHGAASYGPPPLTPLNSSSQPMFSPSSTMIASPTTSTSGSTWSRRESIGQDDYRRRTWHPETYSSFTSPLAHVTRPNYYDQDPTPPSTLRLPGIESFDPLPPRPSTPPRRAPSPMDMDYTPSKPSAVHAHDQYPRPDDRRNHAQWDMGLHTNLTRLDLARGGPVTQSADTTGSWASDVNRAVQEQADRVRTQPTVRFEPTPHPAAREAPSSYQTHQHRISAPPLTPRDSKRHGWYSGPISSVPVIVQQDSRAQRTSPEGSSSSEGGIPSTPGRDNPVGDYHPSIIHANGHVEPSQRPVQPSHPYGNYTVGPDSSYTFARGPGTLTSNPPVHQEPKPESMLRLEALVAVATSEKDATAAY